MAKPQIIPSRLYEAGTRTVNIPSNIERKFIGCRVVFTREDWPADLVFDVACEASQDGVNWAAIGTLGFSGGVLPGGQTTCGGGWEWGENEGDLRVATVNNVAFRTAMTFELIEPA